MLRTLTQFGSNDRGAIAILFGLSLALLLGVAGLSLDYGRAVSLKSKVQMALDAAVLAASNSMVDDSNRKSIFDATLMANYKSSVPLTDFTFSHKANIGGVGAATLEMPNYLMGLFGSDKTDIKVESSARFDDMDLELIFVIDISGSMKNNNRLAEVQIAANKLIENLRASTVNGTSLKVGVVPFNMAVNIGTGNIGLVSGTSNPLFSGSSWGGCVLERPNDKHHLDIYSSGASDGTGNWPAYVWPPEPNGGGCANPSNGMNTGYATQEPWPLAAPVLTNGANYNCPRHALVPLTDNDNAVSSAISNLTAEYNHGTAFGPAVSWAMRLLSPAQPFIEGAAYSKKLRKVIVLLTDGDQVNDGGYCTGAINSVTPYEFDPTSLGLQGKKLTLAPALGSFTPYGYIMDSDPYNQYPASVTAADQELDRLSLEACTEAKKQGATERPIEIYSIAAGSSAGPGTRAYKALSACASSSTHMFYASQESELETVFKSIGQQVSQLRLTK